MGDSRKAAQGRKPLYGAERRKRPRHSDVGDAASQSARIHGRRPCIEVRPWSLTLPRGSKEISQPSFRLADFIKAGVSLPDKGMSQFRLWYKYYQGQMCLSQCRW